MAKARTVGKIIWRILNILVWFCLLLLLVVAFTPLTRWMLRPFQIQEEIRRADLIVVLSGGTDTGRYLSLVSSHRLMRGVQLYFEGRAAKILFSGGPAGETRVADALVMGQEARRLHVPAEDILIDKRSFLTHEQAQEVKRICDSRKSKSVILVTSYLPMKRSLMAFEQTRLKVYPAPADPYELYVADPLGRIALFRQLVQEYGRFILYKFRGWI